MKRQNRFFGDVYTNRELLFIANAYLLHLHNTRCPGTAEADGQQQTGTDKTTTEREGKPINRGDKEIGQLR